MSYKVVKKNVFNYDIKRRLKSLKSSAKRRNLKVDIKVEEYKEWLKTGCSYCGKEVLSEKGYCLDRIDPKKDYYPDNIAVCCKRCNMAKGSMQHDEFFEFIFDVYDYTQQKLKNYEFLKKHMVQERKKLENSYSVKNSRNVNDL